MNAIIQHLPWLKPPEWSFCFNREKFPGVRCLFTVSFPSQIFSKYAKNPVCREQALCLCSPRFNTTVICHEWQFVWPQQALDLLCSLDSTLRSLPGPTTSVQITLSVDCDADPAVAQTLVHSLWRWSSCHVLPFPLQSSYALSPSHTHPDTCLIYSN